MAATERTQIVGAGPANAVPSAGRCPGSSSGTDSVPSPGSSPSEWHRMVEIAVGSLDLTSRRDAVTITCSDVTRQVWRWSIACAANIKDRTRQWVRDDPSPHSVGIQSDSRGKHRSDRTVTFQDCDVGTRLVSKVFGSGGQQLRPIQLGNTGLIQKRIKRYGHRKRRGCSESSAPAKNLRRSLLAEIGTQSRSEALEILPPTLEARRKADSPSAIGRFLMGAKGLSANEVGATGSDPRSSVNGYGINLATPCFTRGPLAIRKLPMVPEHRDSSWASGRFDELKLRRFTFILNANPTHRERMMRHRQDRVSTQLIHGPDVAVGLAGTSRCIRTRING